MLGTQRPCGTCACGTFEVTLTRTDKIILDSHGDVEDKDGSDTVSHITCTSCGTVAVASTELDDERTAALFWEVERHILET